MRHYLRVQLVGTLVIAAIAVMIGVIYGEASLIIVGVAVPALVYVVYRAYIDNQ